MRRLIGVILVLSLLCLPGCGKPAAPTALTLTGEALEGYTIVYSDTDTDYALRAAEYIRDQIQALTGFSVPILEDSAGTTDKEIIVGETEREISQKLDADTSGGNFAIMSQGQRIALEGDYFQIAAAAYYFVQTYVAAQGEAIPGEPLVCAPITKEAKNFIFLIGDGMGPNHTKLYENPPLKLNRADGYSDGEDIFYGYLLPYQGFSRTNSLTGVTDSAASGTALSSGYKTNNAHIGQDGKDQPVKSLTELANELGKATAVMSTEPNYGATPAAFSAHVPDRADHDAITASQEAIQAAGTRILCDFDVYDATALKEKVEGNIVNTLAELEKDPDGFFLMYEEAHIDKHSHSNDLTQAFMALARFNQAIGRFMEYAYYHPDTFLLITADHETGKLLPGAGGKMAYNSDNHTDTDVPVFVHGQGGEVFQGNTVENVQIPKTIAKMWGVPDFGDPTGQPAL